MDEDMRTSNLSILAQHATQTGSILSESRPAYRGQHEHDPNLFDRSSNSNSHKSPAIVRVFSVLALLAFFAVIAQSL